MSYGYQGRPQDSVPYGVSNQDARYTPAPGAQPYYPPQQPVVVNVVQQNAGPGAFVVRRPVNHKLHAWLTLLTGGAWLFVWIPLAIRGKKSVVGVYR
jgi:hypothetical protein